MGKKGDGNSNRDSGLTPPGNPRQLTIFFDGEICVLNDVPPEKVQAFVIVAAAAATAARSASASCHGGAVNSPVANSLESTTSPSEGAAEKDAIPVVDRPRHDLRAGLPLARRSSLQQFLETRRGRLVNRVPYRRPAKTKVKDGKKDSGSHSTAPSTAS